MSFRTGTDPENTLRAYLLALDGFRIVDIAHTVRLILRGEAKGVSKKWVPTPPEFVDAVREYISSTIPKTTWNARVYRLPIPKSKVLVRECAKEWAREHVALGRAPKGSIWIPGEVRENPGLGDLHGPDPDWVFDATPINPIH